jgi:phage gp29-like protein
VREDLREDDIRKEGRTLRKHLLRPLVHLKFGPAVPVPYFRRSLDQPRDIQSLAQVLAVAVNQLGLRVPMGWAHEALGIPLSEAGEASVPGRNGSTEC